MKKKKKNPSYHIHRVRAKANNRRSRTQVFEVELPLGRHQDSIFNFILSFTRDSLSLTRKKSSTLSHTLIQAFTKRIGITPASTTFQPSHKINLGNKFKDIRSKSKSKTRPNHKHLKLDLTKINQIHTQIPESMQNSQLRSKHLPTFKA